MERAAEEFASQTDPDEPPPSPATCRKRNILISLRARKLNKGKIFMNPNKTVQDVLGPEEAAKWTTLSTPARIPNHAYDMMGRALNEVTDMVHTMDGMNEIPRSRLDDELKKLADGAYPSKDDPVQRLLWDQYIKVAASLACSQFERFKKVIIEVIKDPLNNLCSDIFTLCSLQLVACYKVTIKTVICLMICIQYIYM